MNENFILSSNNKTAFLESVSGDIPCIDVNTQRGGRFIVNSITDRNNIPKKKKNSWNEGLCGRVWTRIYTN